MADCFDALISDRPYRKGLPLDRVMQILQQATGKQFDPSVMEAFLRIISHEIQGSNEARESMVRGNRSLFTTTRRKAKRSGLSTRNGLFGLRMTIASHEHPQNGQPSARPGKHLLAPLSSGKAHPS